MRSGSRDVVVLGAGFAGAATAFFLSRARGLKVTLLEAEERSGVHSSGRSAALIRTRSGTAWLDALAAENVEFLRSPPDDYPGDPGFVATGSVFVAAPEQASDLAAGPARALSPDSLRSLAPHFRAAGEWVAIHNPDDGVVAAGAFLRGFVEGAVRRGVDLCFSEPAVAIEVEGGSVRAVRTARRTIPCRAVVVAAGAWAGPLAVAAGARDPQLQPMRRHLLATGPLADVDPSAPFVWDLRSGFYFRPHEGGLLLCACDEEPQPPGACVSDPAAALRILRKARTVLPGLRLVALRLWAGHRTRRADSRFVLGADAGIDGLHLAAGLGGHGVATAAAVGRAVAQAIAGSAV